MGYEDDRSVLTAFSSTQPLKAPSKGVGFSRDVARNVIVALGIVAIKKDSSLRNNLGEVFEWPEVTVGDAILSPTVKRMVPNGREEDYTMRL